MSIHIEPITHQCIYHTHGQRCIRVTTHRVWQDWQQVGEYCEDHAEIIGQSLMHTKTPGEVHGQIFQDFRCFSRASHA